MKIQIYRDKWERTIAPVLWHLVLNLAPVEVDEGCRSRLRMPCLLVLISTTRCRNKLIIISPHSSFYWWRRPFNQYNSVVTAYRAKFKATKFAPRHKTRISPVWQGFNAMKPFLIVQLLNCCIKYCVRD